MRVTTQQREHLQQNPIIIIIVIITYLSWSWATC